MTADGNDHRTHAHARLRGGRRPLSRRPARAPHRCGRRRLLPALAGAAAATALLTGCGTGGTEAPGEETGTGGSEQSSAAEDSADPTTTPEEETPSDDGSDGGGSEGDGPGGENLFEGSWSFGHDEKVLDAEELASLLEDEAESRGPEEMSLEVECADGVDTGIPDYTAECTAYADEGVEHAWLVTVGPADAGLVIEVENTD